MLLGVPACTILMVTFQFIQPEDIGRFLGSVKSTTCLLDLLSYSECLLAVKVARKRLADHLGGRDNDCFIERKC